MKNIVLFIILSFGCLGCYHMINIGSPISPDELQNLSSEYIIINSGQIEKLYSITLDSIKYRFAVDTLNWQIKYIDTKDPQFYTDENLSLNSTYEYVSKFSTEKVAKNPGWGYYFKLPSGWKAVFFVGESGTDELPSNNSLVDLFFKQ